MAADGTTAVYHMMFTRGQQWVDTLVWSCVTEWKGLGSTIPATSGLKNYLASMGGNADELVAELKVAQFACYDKATSLPLLKAANSIATPEGDEGGAREPEHTNWCRSNELDLCSGCSVKKGWDRNGVTGEPTTCRDGVPHEWLPLPCNCGPNDRRKWERRTALAAPRIKSPLDTDDGTQHYPQFEICPHAKPMNQCSECAEERASDTKSLGWLE